MLPRFPCGSIRNIRFACFDFENDEGRGSTLTNIVVLKLHFVDSEIGVKNSEFRMQHFLEGLIVFDWNYA